jgi:hypothetical protein
MVLLRVRIAWLSLLDGGLILLLIQHMRDSAAR